MTDAFRFLDDTALRALAEKLTREPELFPLTESDVFSYAKQRSQRKALAGAFAEMEARGMRAEAAVWVLETLIHERQRMRGLAPVVKPVWSGLDIEGISHRALTVLKDLFREAKYRVWISTFNIDSRGKSEAIFGELAQRYDRGELEVKLFVNIKRNQWPPWKEDHQVVAAFCKHFRKNVWSYGKLPEVYYDPRALDDDKDQLSCLHAKSVMIDDRKVLITSANFSEAAQLRNIEAGVVIEDQLVTETYCRNFQRLIERGLLVPLDFGE